MSMMPKTENDIKQYLDEDKQREIFNNMQVFFQRVQAETDSGFSASVSFKGKKDFLRYDEMGYADSGNYTNGRYFQEDRVIKICAENLSKLISDFQSLMHREEKLQYYSDAYKLCDLVLLHEYMHAYQHIVEGKRLTHGDRLMEEEANRRAAIILTAMWDIDDDSIEYIINFYNEKSEFGFGDNFPVDELITRREDIDYLADRFSS